MGFKKATDYSINKKTNDIVYRYANGEMDRYIKELDSDGVPTGKILLQHRDETGSMTTRVLSSYEMTVDQFDMVKNFSDKNYHEIDNSDVYQSKHTVSMSDMSSCKTIEYSPSAEEEYLKRCENDEQEDIRTLENAKDIMNACLTEKQKRRYYAYYFKGMTMDEIAAEEGIKRHPVWKSIRESDQKIKKFLESGQNRGTKTPEKR